MASGPLDRIAIVLVGTKHPGNLGAVARAMRNMGIRELRLAAPRCAVDDESLRMARAAGLEVLERARLYPDLRSALRGVHRVVGTTAKTGGKRGQVLSPRALAPRVLEVAARQKVGIVFGPEDTGLVDDDLLLCQLLLRIPTQPRARSLNLAQAVMVVCYELYLGRLGRKPDARLTLSPVEPVEAMYAALEQALLDIGFLHPKNARHMMFALRRLLGRAGLTAADVGMLRGIARQIAWYSRNSATR